MLQNPKIYIKCNGAEHLFDTAEEAIKFLDEELYSTDDLLIGIEDDFTRECLSIFDVDCDPIDLVYHYANRLE